MGHHKVIGIFVILLCVLSSTILAQQDILSPCPNVFNYQFDGNQWFGVINVPSPPLGNTLRLNLKLSIKAKLPSKYVGQVELIGEQADLIQKMVNGWNLDYKVHFPLINPIPKVTSILFNGASICSGPPEMFTASGQYVTNVDLQHVLHTTGPGTSGVNQPPEISPPIRPENPFFNTQSQNQNSFRPGQNSVYNQPEPVTNNDLYFDPQRLPSNPFLNNIRTTTRRPWNVYRPDFASQDYNEQRPNPGNFAKPTRTTTARTPIYSAYPQNNQYNSCGKSHTSVSLIIGGDTTDRDEWPWLVAMFKNEVSRLSFFCAGSLISNRLIVTAAHCILQKSNTKIKTESIVLKLGAHDIQDWTDDNAKTTNVAEIIPHPAYIASDRYSKSDIAVLVVNAVQFTQYISPICLWQGDENLNSIVGRKGTVVGWGRDENGLLATPKPRQTKVSIVSTDVCRGSNGEFFRLTSDTTICAGEKDGTGPCKGDSGGGMYLYNGGKWMLRGIVSKSLSDPGSDNQCNLYEYVVFTDAAKYSSWIQQIMYQYNG